MGVQATLWRSTEPTRRRCKPPEDRFFAKVDMSGDCWLWTGRIEPEGYAKFWFGEKSGWAHRFSYQLAKGPIPVGLHIDHLCRVRACVNPEHLEAVTCRVNLLRGNTIPAARAAVTHCPIGHPYSESNTYISPRNQRYCRECARTRWPKKRATS